MTHPTTLHVTNAYHASSGGIRTFYQAMLAAAEREGRRMRLVVPGSQSRIETVGRCGRVYYVRAPRSPFVDRRYRLMLPHTFLTPRGRLAEILRDEQPDLVEVCDKYALCWLAGLLRRGWLAGVRRPTLVGLSCERASDNLGSPARGWRDAIVRWYLGRIYAGQFDVHLANSEYTADELRGAMHPKHPREVHVVPMGVALEGFGPAHRSAAVRARVARALGLAEPFQLLLYAGRLAREKNLGLLVETLARLAAAGASPPIALVIAGSGPLERDLSAALLAAAPGRTCFWGQVHDRHTLAALYASADVFVHPNPREPFGIAPLEAMASGVPVVAPRAGGLLSYASDANAWLAAPTGEAMAAAVRRALAAGPEREGRVRVARCTAAHFDWRRVCRDVFATYDLVHARRLDHMT